MYDENKELSVYDQAMIFLEKTEEDKKNLSPIKQHLVKSMQSYHKEMKGGKFGSAERSLESAKVAMKDMELALSGIDKESATRMTRTFTKVLMDMITSVGVNSLDNPPAFSFGTKSALLANKELLFVCPKEVSKDLVGDKGALAANDFAKTVYRSIAVLGDLLEELKDTGEMNSKQYTSTISTLEKECKEGRAIIDHMLKKTKDIANLSKGYTEAVEEELMKKFHQGEIDEREIVTEMVKLNRIL